MLFCVSPTCAYVAPRPAHAAGLAGSSVATVLKQSIASRCRSCFAQQIGQHRPGRDEVRRPRRRAPQQRLGIADPPLLAHVDAGQAAHRIDVVRILTQGVAQRVDRLALAIGAQVIHRERDLALARRLLEELFERRIGLAAAAEQRQRLPELLVRKRQSRFELDRPLEARHRLLVATLQREHAAEVLVQMREVRLQRQREPHGLLGLRVARLLAERMAEQSQVLDGARVAVEVLAADLLGAQRPVRPQCLERGR